MQSKRGRREGIFVHPDSFDQRFVREIQSRDADPAAIFRALTRLGAPANCQVICHPDNPDNGATVPLRNALEQVILRGHLGDEEHSYWVGMDVILLCVPGRLAYTQDHNNNRAIVHRPD